MKKNIGLPPLLTDFHQLLETAELSAEAQQQAERELSQLAILPINSIEHGNTRIYLEWLTSLPWNKLTGNKNINLRHARHVLDKEHYNLDKIKDRIIEYLAVKKLRQERNILQKHNVIFGEPVLCLVGPPGVGKTSLDQAIAHALGRSFVRISLGGIHDEAEIRGYRRTHPNALPGRIIQGLKRAGTRNPVFILDEIDKVNSGSRGDPLAALLEVLDPAQNKNFIDNYLGIPFDLSQVLFIATANTLETIPNPLQDRMEIVRLSGYTDDEKIHIAQKFLIPKQLIAHGLNSRDVIFEKSVLRNIIRGYTYEAGVRNLEREIARVCRKVATKRILGKTKLLRLTVNKLTDYLGRPRFFDEVAERTTRPGIAIGLAWTSGGGDILFVEAALMPGREGQLTLTGMLGDVMRESAQAALSYVRSNLNLLKIDQKFFEGKAIHLHVPAGAIPKDGPSAGVAILTALVSIITGRIIRHNLAMTGEITLRGKVLQVGGIKEKILAANRAGIKTVILPCNNELDLEDIPNSLRKKIKYIFVNTVEEVLKHALGSRS